VREDALQEEGKDGIRDEDGWEERLSAQCFGSDGALAAWEREAVSHHHAQQRRIHGVRVGVNRLVKALKARNHAARAAQQLEANQLRSQLDAAHSSTAAGERLRRELDTAQEDVQRKAGRIGGISPQPIP